MPPNTSFSLLGMFLFFFAVFYNMHHKKTAKIAKPPTKQKVFVLGQ
jgi:hypothetical protein